MVVACLAAIIGIEVNGNEAGIAGAADVVADGVADVERLFGPNADRVERVAEDFGRRLGHADDRRIDDRQDGDTQPRANLADLVGPQLLFYRAVRVADDAELDAARRQL